MPEPIHVAMIQRIQQRFFLESIEAAGPVELDPFGPVSEGLERLGLEVTDELRNYVDSMPIAIGASLLAVAGAATKRSIPVSFAWLAGAEFEMTVAQANRAGGSLITVILRGPSPSDLTGGRATGA